jgi:CrcB protein
MFPKLLWLAFAGALGTLARWGLSGLVQRAAGESFPWGTWVVNALGCLAFGFVWSLAEDRMVIRVETRYLVLTGFMGAFTTFSTFAFEAQQLLRDGQHALFAAYVLGQNVAGLLLIVLGIKLGAWV